MSQDDIAVLINMINNGIPVTINDVEIKNEGQLLLLINSEESEEPYE